MDHLPAEIKLNIFRKCISVSSQSCLALSATKRTFYTIFKEHEAGPHFLRSPGPEFETFEQAALLLSGLPDEVSVEDIVKKSDELRRNIGKTELRVQEYKNALISHRAVVSIARAFQDTNRKFPGDFGFLSQRLLSSDNLDPWICVTYLELLSSRVHPDVQQIPTATSSLGGTEIKIYDALKDIVTNFGNGVYMDHILLSRGDEFWLNSLKGILTESTAFRNHCHPLWCSCKTSSDCILAVDGITVVEKTGKFVEHVETTRDWKFVAHLLDFTLEEREETISEILADVKYPW